MMIAAAEALIRLGCVNRLRSKYPDLARPEQEEEDEAEPEDFVAPEEAEDTGAR